MENKTKSDPKTILYCLEIAQGFLPTDFESVFLSGDSFFIVLAILDWTICYKNLGTYIINPITIAVMAAKNTAPAEMSFMNPILSW